MKSFITFTALALITTAAYAAPYDTGTRGSYNASANVDQRIDYQRDRIDRAQASGRLTDREAARLDRRVDRVEARANRWDDNGLSVKERARLDKSLDKDRRHITREARDRQFDRDNDGMNDRRQYRADRRWDRDDDRRYDRDFDRNDRYNRYEPAAGVDNDLSVRAPGVDVGTSTNLGINR